jgi:hypothetical protein
VSKESSNFSFGHYFVGALGSSKVSLYYLDTEGLERYRFILSIEKLKEEQACQVALSLS